MTFKKGESGNPEGKKPGTLNKSTRQIKDVINRFLECTTDKDIKSMYKEMKKDTPQALLRFFGQIAPKDLNVKGDIGINPLLAKLDETTDNDNNTD